MVAQEPRDRDNGGEIAPRKNGHGTANIVSGAVLHRLQCSAVQWWSLGEWPSRRHGGGQEKVSQVLRHWILQAQQRQDLATHISGTR